MDLRRLIQNTDCQLVRGDALTEVTALCCDSRCAGPGALFVCLPGRHTDGRPWPPGLWRCCAPGRPRMWARPW